MQAKTSDHVIALLKEHGIDTAFCITGGASAHLMESLRTSGINVIHNYNEQACTMAAEGYARIAKKPALVLVTNGPGSTNTLTGVVGAWQDGIPMIIISGQVPQNQTLSAEIRPLRQLGLQEVDIISMVLGCTKYTLQVTSSVDYHVRRALTEATTGRMGPVWLDIPLDVQAEMIDIDVPVTKLTRPRPSYVIPDTVIDALRSARRPLIVAGNGIHLANGEDTFGRLVRYLQIPTVCTWNATDLFDYNDPLYVGNFGLLGERAGNFAIQRADLLLILGSRLSIPCTGYNSKGFAGGAIKIMVDIDSNEIHKHTLDIDHPCIVDVNEFMQGLLENSPTLSDVSEWTALVNGWKTQYGALVEPHTRDDHYINSFDFIAALSPLLPDNSVVVTDMGTSFTCTMQTLRSNGRNRLFTSSALCSMGFGLPGAIGAYVGNPNNMVICIAGDGGFQMNIQELQTIVHYNLPIKMIILNNSGYLAISLMQDNLFGGNHFGADPDSGVSSPNFTKVGEAYGIKSIYLENNQDLGLLATTLSAPGPAIIEVNMVRNQLIIPRVQSQRDASGKIISGSIDNMYPFLNIKDSPK